MSLQHRLRKINSVILYHFLPSNYDYKMRNALEESAANISGNLTHGILPAFTSLGTNMRYMCSRLNIYITSVNAMI
jgi:hypothetical protein